jgi:hypothetical protein
MRPIVFEYEFKTIQGLPGMEIMFSKEDSLNAIILFVTPSNDNISKEELFSGFKLFDVFRVARDFFSDKILEKATKEELKQIFEETEANL